MLAGAISLCESPAEWMLACALFATSLSNGAYAFGLPKWGRRWELALQHPVGPYRVDIAVLNAPRLWAIEVDGHEFHERAREQVIADNERSRALQDLGWNVRRYSGTEINRDPRQCARTVLNALEAEMAVAAARCAADDPLAAAIASASNAGDADEEMRLLARVRDRSAARYAASKHRRSA